MSALVVQSSRRSIWCKPLNSYVVLVLLLVPLTRMLAEENLAMYGGSSRCIASDDPKDAGDLRMATTTNLGNYNL